MFGNSPSSSGGSSGGNRFPSGNNKFPQVDHRMITDFVNQFSNGIRYWKAVQCPCMTEITGQPKINCGSCRGLGWAYSEQETDPKFQRAMVHSRRSRKNSGKGGWTTQGTASITFQPGVIPGDGDLVQVCSDREVVNNEYHTIGYKLHDGSSGETLRFRDIVCVENVFMKNQATDQIFAVPSTQWEFDAQSRTIIFHGNPYPEGTQYSLRYVAVPEYILKAETATPYLRVAHDDNLAEPARFRKDIVYPFNVEAVRLDRAVLQRHKGVTATTEKSTFNNSQGRGPFL